MIEQKLNKDIAVATPLVFVRRHLAKSFEKCFMTYSAGTIKYVSSAKCELA